MNTIYQRTTPSIRFKIQGIYLCEKLNKHMIWKKNMGINFYIFYFFCLIIKYVCYNRLHKTTTEEIWGRISVII